MIEKLFTSKTRVKLLEYFIVRNKSGRLRQISREVKSPVSAVTRELDNLVQLGIIRKSKDIFILNGDCAFLPEVKGILLKTDSFKFELEKIFKEGDIAFVFAFGSFANETYTSESDIDLFVVGTVSQMQLTKMLKPAERKLGREINPVIWPLRDLKKKSGSSFVKDIAKKNIIMIKGEEDELRKIIGRK